MQQTNIKKLKTLILFLILGFVLLFVFRMFYGYTKNLDEVQEQTQQLIENSLNTRKNYASKEYQVKVSNANQPHVKVDQKYEKIAEINSKSDLFEDDEKQVRSQIELVNALIQFEQKSGNKGYRILQLIIGVPPENFDALYNSLVKIGRVQAKQITKKDKTNEYKELNAKKSSLEKIRTSLIDLKTKGGKIEEYMALENRILEIEQQLQDLGVSLGDFDDENEFCTVQFSLMEGKVKPISFAHRLKVSLEWTVKIYLQLMVTFFFLTLFSYFLLLVIEKLKLIERVLKKND
ncbi:MAG: DUF4349 domain-containing protein [Bacteroidales bacterium]|nr:MAG: DUF4349 domain-containing protein [Bacteroidales bacterium]